MKVLRVIHCFTIANIKKKGTKVDLSIHYVKGKSVSLFEKYFRTESQSFKLITLKILEKKIFKGF